MSSMTTRFSISLLAIPALFASAACQANDGSEWDTARAQLIASSRGDMAHAVSNWEMLVASDSLNFASYAGFLLAYPGFPEETKLRRNAERALERAHVEPGQIIALFDAQPPLSNAARAKYAMALHQAGRSEAGNVARAAWRSGAMGDTEAALIQGTFGQALTLADHDARMDALLWNGTTAQAERQLGLVSPQARGDFVVRVALMAGSDLPHDGTNRQLLADPGYIWQRARHLRRSSQAHVARRMLANRPALEKLPFDHARWVEELLVNARAAATAGDADTAYQIAARIDDGFAPGADISRLGLDLRDDYTSLMWLAGTQSLWSRGRAGDAAPMFYRYGAAARTPQTRSKGFYWAGKAMAQAGNQPEANRYFEMAAAFGDHFYGQLALERLGRPIPSFAATAPVVPGDADRRNFAARPLAAAVREVARDSSWKTSVQFFRAIAENPQTAGEYQLLADYARSIGRRDLGVIMGQAARAKGLDGFQQVSFPLIPIPPGYENNWTMIHAITRQESQFSQNALSHAGARGLMQLMPGTAREQAGKIGLSYQPTALVGDPQYNIQLGSSYFSRMLDYYGGSYPLAVAAYNAGPGNVNRWLRSNGDPRGGGIDWLQWIERIPLSETRSYVQRVIENAVVYDAMHPDKANYRGSNPVSHYLGKQQPG